MENNQGPQEKAGLSFTLILSFFCPTFKYINTLFLKIFDIYFLELYNELWANPCIFVCSLYFTFYLFKDSVFTLMF